MTAGRFRMLVVVWACLYAWWATLPYSAYERSLAVQAAMQHAGRGASLPLSDTLANLLLTATIVAAAGLLVFRAWARWLLLISTAFSVIHAPFGGVMVAGPFDGTLGFLVTLLTGALIAVTFTSPVASEFARRHRAAEIDDAAPEHRQSPDEELVTVFQSSDAALIPVIGSLLQSAQIEYTTTSENLQDLVAGGRLAGLNPAVGPVRFLVRESDALLARDVLQLALPSTGE